MLSELSNKDKLRLLPLLNHTGVSVSPYDKESYLVRFNGVEWVLWLDDKQWASIEGKKPSKEIYYGDLDTFIQKNILKLKHLPKNHGKAWSNDEVDRLYDLIANELTCNQIAKLLQRTSGSILLKAGSILKCEVNSIVHNRTIWDEPLIGLIIKKDTNDMSED